MTGIKKCNEIKIRCEQGSNLRGETPLDFKSNALTTRPSQHATADDDFKYYSTHFFVNRFKCLYEARITNMAKDMDEVDDVIAKLSGPSEVMCGDCVI